MTIKKYLTTPEEILALRNTDTKIYTEDDKGYYQFIQDVLFHFSSDGSFSFFSGFGVGNSFVRKYILVEEPVEEATEKDIGYLCYFYEESKFLFLGILEGIDNEGLFTRQNGSKWTHCRRVTSEEVAKITGYKVEALQ